MATAIVSSTLPAGASTSEIRKARRRERLVPWILLAPTLTILTVVGFYPLVHSLYISMTGYRPTQPTKDQGFLFLDNYATALDTGQFWDAIALTGVFTASSVVASFLLGLGLALLFNANRPGFVAIRSLLLIPMLVTPIAVGIIWRVMMAPDFGVLNQLLEMVGLPRGAWIGSTSTALMSVVLVDIWQWTPFMFIIIFAGVRALPRSPFEAAAIDGAGPFKTFWYVTLPMLRPVIVIAVLLRMIDAVRTYDTVYIMTRGGPNLATDLVSIYLQRINFQFFDLGFGAALSWIILVLVLLAVLVLVKWGGGVLRGEASEAEAQ
jgi:multiple sugar transport system permease protein